MTDSCTAAVECVWKLSLGGRVCFGGVDPDSIIHMRNETQTKRFMTVTERTNGGPSGAVINCNYPVDERSWTQKRCALHFRKCEQPLPREWFDSSCMAKMERTRLLSPKQFDKQHFDAKQTRNSGCSTGIWQFGGAKEPDRLAKTCLSIHKPKV